MRQRSVEKIKKAEILSEKDKRENSAKLTPANDLFGQILAWHRMLALSILASLISINEVAMTRHDQQILFTALAFLAVVQKDGEKATEGSAQKVMMLARLLGEFCAENVPSCRSHYHAPRTAWPMQHYGYQGHGLLVE